MRGPRPEPIHLTRNQQPLLEQIVRRTSSPQAMVLRARIILAAARGERNQHIAQQLKVARITVRTWRTRWRMAADQLQAAEANGEVEAIIRELLQDAARCGAPATFTPEQLCQLMVVACEKPEASGRPVTHWTPLELAKEVVKRGIVKQISPRSVGRFLKRGQAQAAFVNLLAD